MKLLAGIAFLGFASSVSAAHAMPFDFTYSGGLVDFSVPATGDYQILAFGAQGGSATSGSLIGALAHSIAKRFGKSRIVEDPDLPGRKKSRHRLRLTGSRQRAGDDDPVIAGEHPGEALAVTLRQRLPQPPLLLPRVSCGYFSLFGSGFAGLGFKIF